MKPLLQGVVIVPSLEGLRSDKLPDKVLRTELRNLAPAMTIEHCEQGHIIPIMQLGGTDVRILHSPAPSLHSTHPVAQVHTISEFCTNESGLPRMFAPTKTPVALARASACNVRAPCVPAQRMRQGRHVRTPSGSSGEPTCLLVRPWGAQVCTHHQKQPELRFVYSAREAARYYM